MPCSSSLARASSQKRFALMTKPTCSPQEHLHACSLFPAFFSFLGHLSHLLKHIISTMILDRVKKIPPLSQLFHPLPVFHNPFTASLNHYHLFLHGSIRTDGCLIIPSHPIPGFPHIFLRSARPSSHAIGPTDPCISQTQGQGPVSSAGLACG